MTAERLMQEIEFPEEGRKTVEEFILTKETYEKWKICFYEDTGKFLDRAEKEAEKEKLILTLYILFAVDLYDEFRKQGISDQIYYDTFQDFTIWYQDFVRKNGRCGLGEKRWLALHLNMEIYRLGRLQFQPGELETDVIIKGQRWKRRTKVLHVHIPEGTSLNETSCDESFGEAEKFFQKEYELFDCDSWLLAPELIDLIPHESNILKFQRRFHVCNVEYDYRQAEERIFGEILEEKVQYPEDTNLQRKVKQFLLQGGNVGIGYGVLPRNDIKIVK